jgi:hypothetical protein
MSSGWLFGIFECPLQHDLRDLFPFGSWPVLYEERIAVTEPAYAGKYIATLFQTVLYNLDSLS